MYCGDGDHNRRVVSKTYNVNAQASLYRARWKRMAWPLSMSSASRRGRLASPSTVPVLRTSTVRDCVLSEAPASTGGKFHGARRLRTAALMQSSVLRSCDDDDDVAHPARNQQNNRHPKETPTVLYRYIVNHRKETTSRIDKKMFCGF